MALLKVTAPPSGALFESNVEFSMSRLSLGVLKYIAPPETLAALSVKLELIIWMFGAAALNNSAPPLSALPFTKVILLIVISDTDTVNILAPLSPLI